MLISLVSAKGSPGVTTATLALGARWPRPAVVVDADPFGGDIPAGMGRGSWPAEAGLLELVVDCRTVDVQTALRARVFRPGGHCPPALAGFGGLGQARTVPWPRIAPGLAAVAGADVLADCGRFAPTDGVAPLLRASGAVVLVAGSSLRAARAAARLVAPLREVLGAEYPEPGLWLLVVGAGRPYPAAEIARGCGLALLGELPHDPRAAAVWSDGAHPGRWFARSALQRESRRIAGLLLASAAAGARASVAGPGGVS